MQVDAGLYHMGQGRSNAGRVLKIRKHMSRHGQFPKLWSLFGCPKQEGPPYNKDPKRDHIFENYHMSLHGTLSLLREFAELTRRAFTCVEHTTAAATEA